MLGAAGDRIGLRRTRPGDRNTTDDKTAGEKAGDPQRPSRGSRRHQRLQTNAALTTKFHTVPISAPPRPASHQVESLL